MFLREDAVRSLLSAKEVPLPPGGVVLDVGEAVDMADRIGYPVAIRPLDHGPTVFCEEGEGVKAAFPEGGAIVEKKIAVDNAVRLTMSISEKRRQPFISIQGTGDEHVEWVDPLIGFDAFRALRLLRTVDWTDKELLRGSASIITLYELFETTDAELLSVDHLAIVGDMVYVVAPSLYVDDEARARHPDLRDAETVIPKRPLGGCVGCVVSGRGMARVVEDALEAEGTAPSRVIDLGTAPRRQDVYAALEECADDPGTTSVLVALVGSLRPCTEYAEPVETWHQRFPNVPLVVRLAGLAASAGRTLLGDRGIPVADSLEEAAQQIVKDEDEGNDAGGEGA